MTISPFRACDYLEVWGGPRAGDPIDREWAAAAYEKGGPAFTARQDGQILACGGFIILWPRVASAWIVIAPLGRKAHGLALHFAVARELEAIIRLRSLRRVEADVDAENPIAMRWMRCLGFHLEAVRPLRGPKGETLAHYAKLIRHGS